MKDLLKYGLIASAGQPRNLTGEGIVALGALFTQMDFGLKSEEEELITDEPTEKYLKDKLKFLQNHTNYLKLVEVSPKFLFESLYSEVFCTFASAINLKLDKR